MDATITITAGHTTKVRSAYYDTEVEAAELAALFPKSAKVRVDGVTGPGRHAWMVTADIVTGANGINKGANETGLRRLATIRRTAAKAGVVIVEREF